MRLKLRIDGQPAIVILENILLSFQMQSRSYFKTFSDGQNYLFVVGS